MVGARPRLPPCQGCACRLVLFTQCFLDHQLYQLARRQFNMSTAAAGGTRSADVFGHSFLYFYSSQRHGIGLRPMTLARPPIRSQIDGVFASRGCAVGGPGISTDLVFERDSGKGHGLQAPGRSKILSLHGRPFEEVLSLSASGRLFFIAALTSTSSPADNVIGRG